MGWISMFRCNSSLNSSCLGAGQLNLPSVLITNHKDHLLTLEKKNVDSPPNIWNWITNSLHMCILSHCFPHPSSVLYVKNNKIKRPAEVEWGEKAVCLIPSSGLACLTFVHSGVHFGLDYEYSCMLMYLHCFVRAVCHFPTFLFPAQ